MRNTVVRALNFSDTYELYFTFTIFKINLKLVIFQLQYPVYWDHLEFCDGFRKLLDHLQLDKVSTLKLVTHM